MTHRLAISQIIIIFFCHNNYYIFRKVLLKVLFSMLMSKILFTTLIIESNIIT